MYKFLIIIISKAGISTDYRQILIYDFALECTYPDTLSQIFFYYLHFVFYKLVIENHRKRGFRGA